MIEVLMKEVLDALPERSPKRNSKTVPEICLTFDLKEWQVFAGGHWAVHIGEWGGDYEGYGKTAEEALKNCLANIKANKET